MLRIDRSEPGERAGVRVAGSVAATADARSRASGITRWPPATSVSLLAVATTLPARSAARTGRRLTTPPVATIDEVDVVAGGECLERIRSPDALDGGWEVEARECGLVTERDGTGPQPAGLLREESRVGAGRECDDRECIGVRGKDLDGLASDRTRRAEERDAACGSLPFPTPLSEGR